MATSFLSVIISKIPCSKPRNLRNEWRLYIHITSIEILHNGKDRVSVEMTNINCAVSCIHQLHDKQIMKMDFKI